ncbi:hypothetical protein E2C00_13575 [Streptomyces sp. WAC05374]|uniref:hypothetical protein n=1 Tax=Streptomyces sp. WAC05374 TaxID=2487420 RepID=UPI000F86788D|nr:hypothetical protein [Streptomyces sp. WAC05374]RST15279.1 hypothetical protein EF905_15390 [Streptomyces sp. WAC05374]TDF44769.1 hypothetical protein E2B92_15280 [Streptomyces sp. WAC05374]TDF56009.1 hypothetical protein E2C00_13575 [Streptomyces sp. WAC05374]TDF59818.1 hypothetical protein E2C02_03885 [Streptomyces sp. WAC05374]
MHAPFPAAPAVRLRPGAGTLDVTGPGLPHVRLVRAPGTEPDPLIPIGTRDPALLTLTVDGRPAGISPAKGRLSRRSYRVDARVGGTRYRLVPCSHEESRLLRDGRKLGELESTGDGRVTADWDEHAEVLAEDAAVGAALAAAFGTGARPMWETTLDMVSELIP